MVRDDSRICLRGLTMALDLETTYGAQVNAADANYPFGSGKNDAVPGDQSGTPFDQAWFNDLIGYFQKTLDEAGITPSGNPDTIVASDYWDALQDAMAKKIADTDPAIKTVSGTTYQLLAADAGKIIRFTNAAAITVTVPLETTESIGIGKIFTLRQIGDGQITVSPETGAVNLESEVGLKSRAKYAYISLDKELTDTWGVAGGLVA